MADAVPAYSLRNDTNSLSDEAVVSACAAAKAAIKAFDEAAKRGEGFSRLYDLSERERVALSAASLVKSVSPTGIAEKALLLDCVANASGRSAGSPNCAQIALSLAADAIALAKLHGAIAARAPHA